MLGEMISLNDCVPHLYACMYTFVNKRVILQDANAKGRKIVKGLVVNLQKQK